MGAMALKHKISDLGGQQERIVKKKHNVGTYIVVAICVAFIVELGIILAMLTGPTINMMESMTTSMKVNVNVDTGKRLTGILSDQSLLTAGSKFLGGSKKGNATVAASGDDDDLFTKWCSTASCMASKSCEQVQKGLASARADDGSPIMPLPKTFCDAIDILNSGPSCLCDPDLADDTVVGQTATIVKTKNILLPMCNLIISNC